MLQSVCLPHLGQLLWIPACPYSSGDKGRHWRPWPGSSFRLILILEGSLAVWTLLGLSNGQTIGVWVVLAFPPLTWPNPVTVAYQDSRAQAGHSSVSKEARWVEREEAREQQVDARS